MRKTMNVTVYSKPACVQCTATTRALDRQGIDYKVIDISADANAFDLVQGMGYRQVPVVVAGENHWAGFRPDMISSLA
ncbi:glutaredoxin [Brucella melitensis bv. 1 str. 16M]|nr:glutaredoxin [Brucella melitensis bv. 1 str. 16M]EFH33045.1 glutaredoxin-like protein NrdH [Brucella abortus bv. 5 str. B3196]